MTSSPATPALAQLLALFDEAFEGATAWHSLVGNLRSLAPEDWLWVPPGGHRSIHAIIQHVGGSKYMYQDYAFGTAMLRWDDPLAEGRDALTSSESALAWLRAGQHQLRESIAALGDDAELLRPRMTNWESGKRRAGSSRC